MGDLLQVQGVDELVDGQLLREIGLVSKDQQWNSLQYRLVEQSVELIFRDVKALLVRGIDDIPMTPSAYGMATSSSTIRTRLH